MPAVPPSRLVLRITYRCSAAGARASRRRATSPSAATPGWAAPRELRRGSGVSSQMRAWIPTVLAAATLGCSGATGASRTGSEPPTGAHRSVATPTVVLVSDYSRCVKAGACVASTTQRMWQDERSDPTWRQDVACNGGWDDRATQPMNCIDWTMAKQYCAWVGQRLPTVDQAQIACSGLASPTGFCCFDSVAGIRNVAAWTATPKCTQADCEGLMLIQGNTSGNGDERPNLCHQTSWSWSEARLPQVRLAMCR